MATVACALIAAPAYAAPIGGEIVSGAGAISQSGAVTNIQQASQNLSLTWNSFNIAPQETVNFVQPSASAIAVNRIADTNGTQILGRLNANGQVYLINPNGVLFGQGAQVNVGGLVASTLDLNDASLASNSRSFSGNGQGEIVNLGAIHAADGGYVALVGNHVTNQGITTARLGAVALGAGSAATLTFGDNHLVSMRVDENTLHALAENGGLVQAAGGLVLMSAGARDSLVSSVVNNTGVIEAHTVATQGGVITLLAGMATGNTIVGGTLDASAPNGGNGGFIETSAAHVHVAGDAHITTAAASGAFGMWLIDPLDYVVGAGGNITGSQLSADLTLTNVTIDTSVGAGATQPGNGDIFVNDDVDWTAATTLTLISANDVFINGDVSATNGNLVVCCGRDIEVEGDLTTVRGSILLNAGRNVTVFHAITTTDGNLALCAGHNVIIEGAITVTNGSTIPSQSLSLPRGLTIISGWDGTGPGVAGGTILFDPLAPQLTVTNAPATLAYNPISYAAPTDYLPEFTLTGGATLTQRMLLFPDSNRPADGTTATTLAGFRTTVLSGLPQNVTLVAGTGASATFDSAGPGTDIGITYSGYTLAGADADQYALVSSCCDTANFRTRGTITAATLPTPLPGTPAALLGTAVDATRSSATALALLQTAAVVSSPTTLAVVGEGVRMPLTDTAATEEEILPEGDQPAQPPIYTRRQDRQ